MARLYLVLLTATLAVAAAHAGSERSLVSRGTGDSLHGGPAEHAAKAGLDTFLLMGPGGSGAPYIGDFEAMSKTLDPNYPNVHGWTSIDFTEPTFSHWNVNNFDWSDLASVPGFEPINGLYSAWCGDPDIESCDGAVDATGGYGNSWNDILEFRGTVTDNGLSCTLTITGSANVFSEPGYDGTTLNVEKADVGFVAVNYWDGVDPAVVISDVATYLTGEYMGGGADEVVVLFQFKSDGGWDDQDCSFPSTGAILLDDMEITSDNGVSTGGVVDFEGDTLAPFNTRLAVGVGDFAKIWYHLTDLDPCTDNWTHQVAFIDDGVVVPGTGGSLCQDWCYGPGGYIVNTTGGLVGPGAHLNNAVVSPAMTWPDPDHRGGQLTFSVYRHENLSVDAPGMFYIWHVRSTDSGDPADLDAAPWKNRLFVHYGGPEYYRHREIVDDLLVPNATHVQVRVAVLEWGWWVPGIGDDGYPAPYFDNIRFETYPIHGPSLSAREIDLANDGFPESGTIDLNYPGSLWLRFDMARNISPSYHQRRDFGDSVVFDCVVIRQDAVLDGAPELVYKVRTNPVFDPYRTDPTPYTGSSDCDPVTDRYGETVPGRFYADLPDTGWLFPGDVVHYYFEASDRDTITESVETAILPADTTGFSDFDDASSYSPSFVMRALPKIRDALGTQPSILFWNDFGDRGGRDEWYGAFTRLGLVPGQDLDVFYTNGPSSGVGNGLGGKATAEQLAQYDILLYTAGDLGLYTLANGDFDDDSGEDVQTLAAWLDTGNKHAFLTGDDLARDLAQSGAETGAFLADMMNVSFQDTDLRDFINGQTTPLVLVTDANPVFTSVSSWIAYGGCPRINVFDAVTPADLGTRIAAFAGPGGGDGGYPYAAATLATGVGAAGTSQVISLPYDFMFIRTDPNEEAMALAPETLASQAARTRILGDVLGHFGYAGSPPDPSDVPEVPVVFTVRHSPNPFNPLVHIGFTILRPGHLAVRVYDLRGRLVRTVLDEHVTAGNELTWDGRDERGANVASGVYFYEARMHGEVRLGKMTLVR